MKTLLLFLLMILAVVTNAQLKVTQPIIYYKDASFTISPLIPIATVNTAPVPLKQFQDTLRARLAGGGAGTVTSVGSGLGLTGTVTSSGVLALDTASASVLSRQRAVHEYAPKSHVGSTGTAHGTSTTSVAGFMSSTDKTKLDGIATGATANTGTVTSVGSGLGLTGTVTTSGTLALDTANSSVLSRQRAVHEYQSKLGFTPYNSTNPAGYNTGTVTSVGSGLGLTGTVTTSGTLALDTANASVLSRQRAAHEYQTKLGFTPYNSTNPAGYTNNTGTVTSIGTGLGLTGGTVTTSGTLSVDTANVSILSRQRAAHEYSPKESVVYLTSNVVMTAAPLANIPGLSLPLAANSTYLIEFNLVCQISVNSDIGFGINLSSTTGANISGTLMGPTSIAGYTGARSKMIIAFNTSTTEFYSLSTVVGGTIFKGIVTTGSTAPTLYVQSYEAAANLTISTLSYLRALKLQ